MRILRNAGSDRVLNVIKPELSFGGSLDAVSPAFSLFALEALRDELAKLAPAGETTCVFRDCAFADDVAKSKVAAILEQHGLTNLKSL